MKFGFTVNIDKKKKQQETIKEIVKQQIKEHSITQETTTISKQTGNSKNEDDSISIKETKQITEHTENIENTENNIIKNKNNDNDNDNDNDISGNNKFNSKKIQIINNNQEDTFNKKMILMFQNCNYDCKVKFKCIFSVACFKNAINTSKNAVVNSVSCVASSISNAICTTTKCITSNVYKATNCVAKNICKATKCVSRNIKQGYSNMTSNISYAYYSTTSFFKKSYISTKNTITHSYIYKHIKNINNWRITIYTKKTVKTFFIYLFCLFICIKNKKLDKNSEEYKEEYIRNNATYSTEFDHLPILGDDAIV
jgi:hypothetical protein